MASIGEVQAPQGEFSIIFSSSFASSLVGEGGRVRPRKGRKRRSGTTHLEEGRQGYERWEVEDESMMHTGIRKIIRLPAEGRKRDGFVWNSTGESTRRVDPSRSETVQTSSLTCNFHLSPVTLLRIPCRFGLHPRRSALYPPRNRDVFRESGSASPFESPRRR